MANILIEPAKAKTILSREDSLESALKRLSQDVESIRGGLRFRIAAQQNISQNLRSIAEQIDRESRNTRAMREGLEQVIAHYEQTEKGNRDLLAAEKHTDQQTSGNRTEGTVDGWERVDFKWGDLLIKELGNLVGPAGFLFTGGQKLFEGDWGEAINELVKSLGKSAKVLIDKPKAEWFKELFGLNRITKENMPTFGKELGNFSTFGNTVGTVAKWGTALVDSMLKNVEEFGDNSWGGRFWAETVTEAGIKLIEGAAIKAGVAAVAVAAFGSAPALAVSAAAVGLTMFVDWGLDNIVSWATGGAQTSWIEAVSDFVCNKGEEIVDAVGSVVTKAVDTVKDVADATVDTVKKGWKKLKEGASNLFSGCRWGSIFC